MNIVQRQQDLDFEADVLKFKQVWNQMKQTNKDRVQKYQNDTKDGTKIDMNSRNHSKNQSKTQSKLKQKPKQPKKHLICSQKNIVRNPKHNPQKVIEVETNPKGYYKNSMFNQKNNIQKQTLIQTAISPGSIVELTDLQKSIGEKDYEISILRVNNTRNLDRITALQQIISEKDQKIWELETKIRELVSKANGLMNNQKIFDYGKIQYQNFKNDSRRLLKILQTTTQYQQFANLALDDNGVRFLHEANKKFKSSIDTKQRAVLHFCTCNKQFIPEVGFWVPEKIYSYGKQFIKERKGELTLAQMQLMLYDLNKIWRERQKKIINTINSQKSKQIEKLKRKITLQQSKSTKQIRL